nr:hypothetical protein [Tanacetum cinerariifolium]
MVSNVNVLGPGVLDIIAAESNDTAIVTIQRNLIEDKVAVSATAVYFGYQRPQLMVPLRYQKTRLSTSRVLDQLDPWKICCPEEIMTEYHTTPEEPALTRTKPSLDDKHVPDGRDQRSPSVD